VTWAILALVISLLILVNGTCVAAELSLVGARRSRLLSLAEGGNRSARHVLGLTGSYRAMDRTVATAQVGITLSSLGLGMYAEESMAHALLPLFERFEMGELAAHGLASTLTVVLLTYLHVVVGEMIPKTVALQHPIQTALLLQAPLRGLRILLAPLVIVLDGASTGILHLLRVVTAGEHARAHTLQEIQALVETSDLSDPMAQRQNRMLRGLLEFEDLPVRKVMVPRNSVIGIPVDAGPEEVLALLKRTAHTRYPVFQGDLDQIIGFVHVKQLLGVLRPGLSLDLRALARAVPMVPEAARARRVLRRFREEQVHLAVVVDEHGGTSGVVTLQDLLAEIFGDVQDEFDAEEPDIRRLSETTAVLRGSVRLDEINEEFGLEFEGRLVDTVAGLILQELGRTARRGDVVRLEDVILTVEEVERLAIARVRLRLRG
jgi:CBS domain containing-hemolysin-like protein